jgi:hypothetical protein
MPLGSGSRLSQKVAVGLLAGILVLALPLRLAEAGSPNYDNFARCVAAKKATMYGAFWCENCKKQKELFGSSFAYINYQECAIVGAPREQTPQCKQMLILKYPTWVFSDNGRLEGLQPLETLSARTGCKLP